MFVGLGVKTLFKMFIDDNFLYVDLYLGNIFVWLFNGVVYMFLSIVCGNVLMFLKDFVDVDGESTSTFFDALLEIIILDIGLVMWLMLFY